MADAMLPITDDINRQDQNYNQQQQNHRSFISQNDGSGPTMETKLVYDNVLPSPFLINVCSNPTTKPNHREQKNHSNNDDDEDNDENENENENDDYIRATVEKNHRRPQQSSVDLMNVYTRNSETTNISSDDTSQKQCTGSGPSLSKSLTRDDKRNEKDASIGTKERLPQSNPVNKTKRTKNSQDTSRTDAFQPNRNLSSNSERCGQADATDGDQVKKVKKRQRNNSTCIPNSTLDAFSEKSATRRKCHRHSKRKKARRTVSCGSESTQITNPFKVKGNNKMVNKPSISQLREIRWISLLGERPPSHDDLTMSSWLMRVLAVSDLETPLNEELADANE